jgi:CO/xanthine dehydrogenase FAD-binding subunit
MIVEYHRPESLAEALSLLSRREPVTVPLGGGSLLNQPSAEPLAVVDLQELALSEIHRRGNIMEVGATATLLALAGSLETEAGILGAPVLLRAIYHEATHNLRNVATIAGTLVGADGRSPLATALLALDARLVVVPGFGPVSGVGTEEEGEEQPGDPAATALIALGDLLPLRREALSGRLITQVQIPLNAQLAYEVVARTPADRPLVCAAAARWPSGRTRLALGGYGLAPVLALDGPEGGGLEPAARDVYSQAGDAWASAEYRSEMAAVLTRRCMGNFLIS